MSVPKLRFKEFEGEWNKSNLESIADLSSGSTPNRSNSNYWGGNIPWVTTSLIDNNIITHASEFITEAGLTNSATRKYPKGSILMAMYGQGITRGKVAILGIEATTNQACASIIVNGQNNNNFVFQNLASRYSEIRSFSNDGGQKNLSIGIIKQITIVTPSLIEQTKISEFLAIVDKKIDQLTSKQELLTKYKAGLLQQIFSQEIRFTKDDGSDFEDWNVCHLGELVRIESGNSPSKYNLKEFGQMPFFKVEELNNCIKYQLLSRNYCDSDSNFIPKNSVIFPKRGAAILTNKVRLMSVNGLIDSNLMALIPSNEIDCEFLFYFILFEKLYKIADTSTIPQLNNKHIKPLKIRLPCIQEQTKIANFISKVDESIEITANQLEQAKTWKKGLLQQMFV